MSEIKHVGTCRWPICILVSCMVFTWGWPRWPKHIVNVIIRKEYVVAIEAKYLCFISDRFVYFPAWIGSRLDTVRRFSLGAFQYTSHVLHDPCWMPRLREEQFLRETLVTSSAAHNFVTTHYTQSFSLYPTDIWRFYLASLNSLRQSRENSPFKLVLWVSFTEVLPAELWFAGMIQQLLRLYCMASNINTNRQAQKYTLSCMFRSHVSNKF
jgi:hypothetical protein